MNALGKLVLVVVIVVAGTVGYAWSGYYNVAADSPHWPAVKWLLAAARDHSVERRAESIKVPPLDNETLVTEGAGHYAEMCAACHLAPGLKSNELRAGLYPKPPELSRDEDIDSAEVFWVVKHGIKMTAMPAWGVTHDDQKLWAIVAFVRQLPKMSAAQYQALVAAAHGNEGQSGAPAKGPSS